MMYTMAFAGFRHGHIYGLLNLVKNYENICIAGAWEESEAAKKEAAEYGVTFTYETYEELLADETVDIVAIGDYYGRRGHLVTEALKAGKHVIADKPLCTSMEEAKEAEKLAREKNLKIGLMLDMRYYKNVLKAQEITDSGAIGQINNIYFGGQHPLRYGTRPGWYFEEGKHGGTINDIAVHGMDLVRRFTKSELKCVDSARCWNFYAKEEPDFQDSAQFMVQMQSGAGVIADVSYAAPNSFGTLLPTYWEFKIWGDKGMLQFHTTDEGVEVYLAGETVPRVLTGIASDRNILDDFLEDIEKESFANTDSVLQASFTVLAIQKQANA